MPLFITFIYGVHDFGAFRVWGFGFGCREDQKWVLLEFRLVGLAGFRV